MVTVQGEMHYALMRQVSDCDLFWIFCKKSDLDSSFHHVDWVMMDVTADRAPNSLFRR
jgi:hypothetical protein